MQKISKAQTHLRILLAGLESNPPAHMRSRLSLFLGPAQMKLGFCHVLFMVLYFPEFLMSIIIIII